MPELQNRQFIELEKPIKELYDQKEQVKASSEKTKTDVSKLVATLEKKIVETKRELTAHLTPWQKVQLSRHPDRPYTLKYIQKMTTNFIELHGDRNVKDDKAMIGGLSSLTFLSACNSMKLVV